jgi:aminoglycoside phosphotransferase (APT) family kinase protein
MTNDDRIEISDSLVAQLIAQQFPHWSTLGLRRVEVDGWDNSTFRLGDDLKVRLPTAARYVRQVLKEHEWLPRVAPLLPLPIPTPVALGSPGHGYPWPWGVYRWLDGETASPERIGDERQFAADLAEFLVALQRIDPTGGPRAGPHSFGRGGPLTIYDAEVRESVAALGEQIDADGVLAAWDAAVAAHPEGQPMWVHGDIAAGNLLVRNGRLSAVVDFGLCAVGDPACDLTVAWTLFSEVGREAFRATTAADKAMWSRARGWALWKALLICVDRSRPESEGDGARRVVAAVLEEHREASA